MRYPAIPLITIDPYFSIWSTTDVLTDSETMHWTKEVNSLKGYAQIDGKLMRFMGTGNEPAMQQLSCEVKTFKTEYIFRGGNIVLTACFMSPVIPGDRRRMSRPVSYLTVGYAAVDGKKHSVKVLITADETLCLNEYGESPIISGTEDIGDIHTAYMENSVQNPLWRSGDDVRIDWGRFYLAVRGGNSGRAKLSNGSVGILCGGALKAGEKLEFAFAYDDVECIEYFGNRLTAYWRRDGRTIQQMITEAFEDKVQAEKLCDEFDAKLCEKAESVCGERFTNVLRLAMRHVMAAHKLTMDENGELLWISKECFSNGCAATVDVSYPSIPMFLLYDPELVTGMMRPIFRFASSDAWPFDFAPHDDGQYPLLNGQVYGENDKIDNQMPVEECGNMLVMAAAVTVAQGSADFAVQYLDTLETWAQYLFRFGEDPENQLCTDDFAGHLAHNCNLAIKAIMGITGLGLIYGYLGMADKKQELLTKARAMAASWLERAANGDGSYKLAFDRPGTFSMKYNAVWDLVWGTHIFPDSFFETEYESWQKHINRYGLPLDNRAGYTKSDWLTWCACFREDKESFIKFTDPMVDAYEECTSRVPLTDWYETESGNQVAHDRNGKPIGFQHRSVQGGLFMPLLYHR